MVSLLVAANFSIDKLRVGFGAVKKVDQGYGVQVSDTTMLIKDTLAVQ